MDGSIKLWNTWAPYWHVMEDQHLGAFITGEIENDLEGPVLVIGAGQGIVVEKIRQSGKVAFGIDLEQDMVLQARTRRTLDMVIGDGNHLPFKNNAFRTVILSTGVVDYLWDEAIIATLIDEAKRVLVPYGALLIAFYKLEPNLERIYEKLGVIVDGHYHMERIFDIQTTVKDSPFKCIDKITRWRQGHRLANFIYFTRLGIRLPTVLKQAQDQSEKVFELARADGVPLEAMLASVPSDIPYRNESEIRGLFHRIGLLCNEYRTFDDCIVARSRNSFIRDLDVETGPTAGANEHDGWIIRTRDLCKRYPGAQNDAVDHVDISVDRGTIFGVLGPNGAGKTTTLSLLCGLLAADSGTVRFGVQSPRGDMRKIIGYVPQNLALYPQLTGRENLEFFGNLHDIESGELARRIAEVMGMVGLTDRMNHLVKTYSTGMMRRLNLAAGLLHEPAILLLDEPTVGIDPQSRHRIFEAVLEARKRGVTILYTTHYMEEASRLCDTVAIMDHGRIILDGSPSELVARYGMFRLEFNVEDAPQGFLDALCSMDNIRFSAEKDEVLCIMTRTDRDSLDIISDINRLANEHEARISLRSAIEPSLESLFLDITGREMRDAPQTSE